MYDVSVHIIHPYISLGGKLLDINVALFPLTWYQSFGFLKFWCIYSPDFLSHM